MKILSIEFTKTWSWGLIFKNILQVKTLEIERIFMEDNPIINNKKYDVLLSQNVTLLKKFKERLKTVCRMGGNYNFDGLNNLEPLLKEMAKCYCLIATNQKLYEIAKSVNNRVYLIPNGLNLEEWKVIKKRNSEKIIAGFCGNISNPFYCEYKGFDITKKACDNLGLELKTALYKNKQIPHEQMKELFYSQIDVLIHPTRGEGSSNTIMEALACGVPVITTREAGYHGENMNHKVDVLFCDRTIRSIQDQLMLLIRFPDLRNTLSKKARLFAERHHDIKKIALKYEKIFQECHEFNKTCLKKM